MFINCYFILKYKTKFIYVIESIFNGVYIFVLLYTRLIGAQIVSKEFNSRACVKWRKYLYRLAVLKPEYSDLCSEQFMFPTPIIEDNRCFFIR